MSQVICFRLDKNNSREAQALAVILSQQEAGFTVRQIMVEALLRLNVDSTVDLPSVLAELQMMLGETQALLKKTQNGGFAPVQSESGNSTQRQLSEGFRESVRKAAKPGMKVG